MSETTFLFSQQILKMFLMVFIGFAAVKLKLLSSDSGKGLAQAVVAVLCPCSILYAFQVEFSRERLLGLLLAVFAAFLSHLSMVFFSWLLGKSPLRMNPVERASIIYTNCGNLLMPLIAAVMGQEWLFYTCAYVGVMNLFVWTHGRSLVCGEPKINWKRALGNMNIIAILLGTFFFCTRITFPSLLGQAVQSIAGALGPICMLNIGIVFATLSNLNLSRTGRVLAVAVCRLMICPLVMMTIFLLLGLHTLLPGAQQILLISLLGVSAPTGATIMQMAHLYGEDADYASLINVVSMLCSMATMPGFIWVYETVTALL